MCPAPEYHGSWEDFLRSNENIQRVYMYVLSITFASCTRRLHIAGPPSELYRSLHLETHVFFIFFECEKSVLRKSASHYTTWSRGLFIFLCLIHILFVCLDVFQGCLRMFTQTCHCRSLLHIRAVIPSLEVAIYTHVQLPYPMRPRKLFPAAGRRALAVPAKIGPFHQVAESPSKTSKYDVSGYYDNYDSHEANVMALMTSEVNSVCQVVKLSHTLLGPPSLNIVFP